MGEENARGQTRTGLAGLSGGSGWITTEVAARAVRVSPRTIRRYIDQGKLEAKPQGEGVRREWLVSVDSLHALRAARTFDEQRPRGARDGVRASVADTPSDSIADVLREMSARLEQRAEEAAELRVRLELTERAQSTLEGERRRALEELAEARRRQEEAERERDELRWELEALKEGYDEDQNAPEPPQGSGGRETASEKQEGDSSARRGFWARLFGG